MGKKRRQKKSRSKSYVLKCDTGKYYGGESPIDIYFKAYGVPKDAFNKVHVTKEELDAAYNQEESPDVAELRMVFHTKFHETGHYYMHYTLDDEEPPKRAEYIAYLFLSRGDRETLLGDLTEEYPSLVKKFGQRAAQIYFYKQVLWSVWPLARKAIIKWGLFGWVVEMIRRISS